MSFRDMLLDALKNGDDVEIKIRRVSAKVRYVV